MLEYYDTETGEKIIEPFARKNAKIPKNCQATKPNIKCTLSAFKNKEKRKLIFEVITTVKKIKMQCKQSDIVNISCAGDKSAVRDVDNKIHSVTEDEFGQIIKDMKMQYSEIQLAYWNKIDTYDYVKPKNEYPIYVKPIQLC